MITQNSLQSDLRALLAEIFHLQTSEISPDAQLGELPQWDSMAHMDLMVALEEKYGVDISAETISQLVSLPAIIAYVEKRQHA